MQPGRVPPLNECAPLGQEFLFGERPLWEIMTHIGVAISRHLNYMTAFIIQIIAVSFCIFHVFGDFITVDLSPSLTKTLSVFFPPGIKSWPISS